ncbi:MAG: undecaprenyl-diphosphate phosphatase [Tannerella sp.]|jgi:undecaprenyl-diphosphatase|nr:undecaprenyl-diphosphate phosphatase [Tannerella sp.]
MRPNELIEALILGIIQGLTEFLPVSSSGHLAIAGTLFGLNGEENLTFAVAVHAATVLSTVCVLWKEVSGLVRGFFAFRWNEETQMLCKIGISMIPVGIVGLLFREQVEVLFGSGLMLTGIMLLITAGLLAFSGLAGATRKDTISFRDAFWIGIAQACAVWPGLSRSGATIAAGLLLGNRKEQVARFSFLMVILPVLGEAVLDLLKGGFSAKASGFGPVALGTGFLAAFVTGTLACRWMIQLIKKGKLIYFAYYCVIAGLFALIYSWVK